ncbi:acyltransferase domain-containing protein [Streptomyces globisporus]|uniref:acyltransferase domain-containing protein n=1 Tax=Streptomyces globisporus TaxID=1908 RepID=UPI00345F7471
MALPHALERQRRLGIPDDIVAATFADLGAKLTELLEAEPLWTGAVCCRARTGQ